MAIEAGELSVGGRVLRPLAAGDVTDGMSASASSARRRGYVVYIATAVSGYGPSRVISAIDSQSR